jgi:hypothetical protein
VVTELATGPPQKPMDWVRNAQLDTGQHAGAIRSAPSSAGRAARRAATHGERDYAWRAALSPRENFDLASGCNNCSAREISRAGVVSVLSRQAAGIMSSDRRPERTDVLLWRVLVDNGPDGSRPKDQSPNPTIPPSPHGQRRIASRAATTSARSAGSAPSPPRFDPK